MKSEIRCLQTDLNFFFFERMKHRRFDDIILSDRWIKLFFLKFNKIFFVEIQTDICNLLICLVRESDSDVFVLTIAEFCWVYSMVVSII